MTRPVTMFRNYLLVALRSIRRQRFYAAISIFGLAAGLACCILNPFVPQSQVS